MAGAPPTQPLLLLPEEPLHLLQINPAAKCCPEFFLGVGKGAAEWFSGPGGGNKPAFFGNACECASHTGQPVLDTHVERFCSTLSCPALSMLPWAVGPSISFSFCDSVPPAHKCQWHPRMLQAKVRAVWSFVCSCAEE